MATELRGSHLFLALDYTNFKLKETGELATSIKEKILILSRLTSISPVVLSNMINNDDIVPKALLERMKKANLKTPELTKVPTDYHVGKALVNKKNATSVVATLDVMTKEEYGKSGLKDS